MFLGDYRQSIAGLRGVGPVVRLRLARIGIQTLSDLIQHFPRDYHDRRRLDLLETAAGKERINTLVRVVGKRWIGRGARKILKVQVADDSGSAALVCFGRSFLAGTLIPGRKFWVSGKFIHRHGELQCSTFDLEAFIEGQPSKDFQRILPLYGLTEGITQALLRRLMVQGLTRVEADLEEELPAFLSQRHTLLPKFHALRAIHFPESMEELAQARKTLIYEQLFYYQLLIEQNRRQRQALYRRRLPGPGRLKQALLGRLPFRLTDDQRRALADIEGDLAGSHPAARLLQGDVGSGKTLVALLACLAVIECGQQVALLAPTALLARQHAELTAALLEPLGIRLGFLSGSIRSSAREGLKEALQTGRIDLLVGTHALFSGDVAYKKLGLVIVDEQQRFGVRQRQAILAKGSHPDLLLMTATPIPRTLAQTFYGDLDLSELRTKPEGRLPVITHLARQEREQEVYEAVRREVEKGHQAYIVYPLIEDAPGKVSRTTVSRTTVSRTTLKTAVAMYQVLKEEVFPELRLELIHARLPEEEKARIMGKFQAGRVNILVATSVLEVGLDVANATCIVIEHAERFGLANLHQLRGRVGRGPSQSYAYLIYSTDLSEEASRRLKALLGTNDGFKIAEQDLGFRGPGAILGVRQSGFLSLGLADPFRDRQAFAAARSDAVALAELLAGDPQSLNSEYRLVRRVLEQGFPLEEV